MGQKPESHSWRKKHTSPDSGNRESGRRSLDAYSAAKVTMYNDVQALEVELKYFFFLNDLLVPQDGGLIPTVVRAPLF